VKKILISTFLLISSSLYANEDRAFFEEAKTFFSNNTEADQNRCMGHLNVLEKLYKDKSMFSNVLMSMQAEYRESNYAVKRMARTVFLGSTDLKAALRKYSNELSGPHLWKPEKAHVIIDLLKPNFEDQKVEINGAKYTVSRVEPFYPQKSTDPIRFQLEFKTETNEKKQVLIDFQIPFSFSPQISSKTMYPGAPTSVRSKEPQVDQKYQSYFWGAMGTIFGLQDDISDFKYKMLNDFDAIKDYLPEQKLNHHKSVLVKSKNLEEYFSKATQLNQNTGASRCYTLLENQRASYQALNRNTESPDKRPYYYSRGSRGETSQVNSTTAN
jgi:hypothetical protein